MNVEIQASFAGDPTFDHNLEDFHALISSLNDEALTQRFHCRPASIVEMVSDIGFVLKKLGGILAIAYSNGAPIGGANLIALDLKRHEGQFEAVVHQDYRRHGVSSRLKTKVFRMAPQIGVRNVLCALELDNVVAIASTINYAKRNALGMDLMKKADGRITYCLHLPV